MLGHMMGAGHSCVYPPANCAMPHTCPSPIVHRCPAHAMLHIPRITLAQMKATTAETVLIARGYSAGESPASSADQKPDREVVLRVTTGDPGYLGTSTLIGQVRYTIRCTASMARTVFVGYGGHKSARRGAPCMMHHGQSHWAITAPAPAGCEHDDHV